MISVFGTLLELTIKPMSRAIAGAVAGCLRRHHVTLVDNLYRNRPELRHRVRGFATRAAAESYAVDRVRASIDSFRVEGQNDDDLYNLWRAEGEDAIIDISSEIDQVAGIGETRGVALS